jgi:hypothetical protein
LSLQQGEYLIVIVVNGSGFNQFFLSEPRTHPRRSAKRPRREWHRSFINPFPIRVENLLYIDLPNDPINKPWRALCCVFNSISYASFGPVQQHPNFWYACPIFIVGIPCKVLEKLILYQVATLSYPVWKIRKKGLFFALCGDFGA